MADDDGGIVVDLTGINLDLLGESSMTNLPSAEQSSSTTKEAKNGYGPKGEEDEDEEITVGKSDWDNAGLFGDLPEDIIGNVIGYLDVKSFSNFTKTCRALNGVCSPFFFSKLLLSLS